MSFVPYTSLLFSQPVKWKTCEGWSRRAGIYGLFYRRWYKMLLLQVLYCVHFLSPSLAFLLTTCRTELDPGCLQPQHKSAYRTPVVHVNPPLPCHLLWLIGRRNGARWCLCAVGTSVFDGSPTLPVSVQKCRAVIMVYIVKVQELQSLAGTTHNNATSHWRWAESHLTEGPIVSED